MVKLTFKYKDDISPYLQAVEGRLGPRHRLHMNKMILARIVHAETVQDFYQGGRPQRWPSLSYVYAKIKKSTSTAYREPNVQNPELGRYPTPWGKIGVRFGKLFGNLGNATVITPDRVIYGTNVSYASNFSNGHIVKRIWQTAKNGRGYYVDLKEPVTVPARHFGWVSPIAFDAIIDTMKAYITAAVKRREVLIPHLGYTILGNGGRRVPIAYSGHK